MVKEMVVSKEDTTLYHIKVLTDPKEKIQFVLYAVHSKHLQVKFYPYVGLRKEHQKALNGLWVGEDMIAMVGAFYAEK